MHHPASPIVDQYPVLLARLPPDMDLDALALAHKAIQRKREIKDAATLLRLGPGARPRRYDAA